MIFMYVVNYMVLALGWLALAILGALILAGILTLCSKLRRK
jgi:hypothetical protein